MSYIVIPMDNGEVLRAARTAAGMSQAQLALAAGTSQPNIAAYETGRRRCTRATLDRLLAATRRQPSEVLHEKREQVLDAARRNGAMAIWTFGSVARGTDRPDSDIDFLVRFRPGASLLDQAGLIEDLEDIFGQGRVDVVSVGALKERDDHIKTDAVAV